MIERLREFAEIESVFSENEWWYISKLIEYHHFFEQLKNEPKGERVRAFYELLVHNGGPFFSLLLILTLADVNSNEKYRSYAKKNAEVYRKLAKEWADDFPTEISIFWRAVVDTLQPLGREAETDENTIEFPQVNV